MRGPGLGSIVRQSWGGYSAGVRIMLLMFFLLEVWIHYVGD